MNDTEMENLSIRRLDSREPGFAGALRQVLAFEASEDEAIDRAADILADVRRRDEAVLVHAPLRSHGSRRCRRWHCRNPNSKPRSRPRAEAPRRAGSRRCPRACVPREAENRMRQP
jgi:hypothetical protein